MNKINLLLFFAILMSFTSFSQDIYQFKSGGRVLQRGKIITPSDIRAQFSENKILINLYDAGRNKKTFGNLFLYSGIGIVIGKFILDGNTSAATASGSPDISNYPYFIGAGLILVAIPIKIGFSKKIKKAIILMNEEIINQKTSYIETTSFVANANGIGLKVTF